MNLNKRAKGSLIFFVVFLAGCSVYKVDEAPEMTATPLPAFSVKTDEPILNEPWWQSFEHHQLNALVEQSLVANYDVAQAVAVLQQATAVARQSASRRLPQLGLELDASQSWEDGAKQRASTEVGLPLVWELDVWQRLSNTAKADNLEVNARVADVEAVRLSLSAEVSKAYFGALSARKQLALLNIQLSLDQDLEKLLQLRFDSGVGTNVDVLQQQSRVADSQTLIPLAESTLAVFENRLDVLLGVSPDGQSRVGAESNFSLNTPLPAIGVPSALLLNRPDLVAARNRLAAADAGIAAAIADRLPSITLTGSYGFEDSSSLTGPVGLLMGSFVQPLLDWGQRKAEVNRNKALYQQRLAQFTQRYLEAVEGVENALIQERKQREFLSRLGNLRDILQETANVAEKRYKSGIDDYQPVIGALRELREVERRLVNEQLNLLNIRIDLFRAIGGPTKAS